MDKVQFIMGNLGSCSNEQLTAIVDIIDTAAEKHDLVQLLTQYAVNANRNALEMACSVLYNARKGGKA